MARQNGLCLRTREPEGARGRFLAVIWRLIDARGLDAEGQAEAFKQERSIA